MNKLRCSTVLRTGLAVAFMGMTLEDTFRSASGAKNMWLQRRISLYKIVDYFLDDILVNPNATDPTFLDRLNVLITTSDGGTVARKATSLEELKDLMLKTVYMYVCANENRSRCRCSVITSFFVSQTVKSLRYRTSTMAHR